MINKGRDKTTEFSPLTFMVYALETIAVILFLVMVIEGLPRSPEDQIALFNLIGFLVLFAWLIRRIDKVVQIVAYVLDTLIYKLLHLLTNTAPTGSSTYEPIDPKNLCSWHKNSFWTAFGVSMLVLLTALVILSMFTLAEGSPVTSTIWDWTYRITMPVLGLCLVWILATIFHARRRCAIKVSDGLGNSTI